MDLGFELFQFSEITSVTFYVYNSVCNSRNTFECASSPSCTIHCVETSRTLNSWREIREAVWCSQEEAWLDGTLDDPVCFKHAKLLTFSEFKLQHFFFFYCTKGIWWDLHRQQVTGNCSTFKQWNSPGWIISTKKRDTVFLFLLLHSTVKKNQFQNRFWLSFQQTRELLFLPTMTNRSEFFTVLSHTAGWLVV